MTFSIVAYDPDEQAWGVAVASKFLAAAAVVSWAQAGAGAVATQAYARVSFGPNGLAMLAEGKSAQETLDRLLEGDPGQADRQVGIVDVQGGTAAHTGVKCFDWAGHRIGVGFTCQGNILTGPETLEAMAETFMTATGELADRLVAALRAGDLAGGDRRGKQSAGVLVVRKDGGYGGDNDRYLDLRVDDDPEPVVKLQSLVTAHHLFFGQTRPEDRLPITEDLARELQAMMQAQGYLKREVNGSWDETSIAAFRAFVGNENLEERWREDDPAYIDRVALDYLRERFGNK
ncbi:MAG TPA: DUF1028 domain-containing protein [Oceanobacillus sp.]|nr:DUF1028 domain-containing protein [Oceanobacillus sp.]